MKNWDKIKQIQSNTPNVVKGIIFDRWGFWERIVPKDIGDDLASQRILSIHLQRYEIAARYVARKRVLDIACGTGYGCNMLKNASALEVVGIDRCALTLEYAMQNYYAPGVEFICADALEFEYPKLFDVIVSYETIEHLQNPEKFLDVIRKHLHDNGIFFLSVPLGETRHFDIYHLHKFSQDDVFKLLYQAGFSIESHHIDECFFSRKDLLYWRHQYPGSSPSLFQLLFTQRGWRVAGDFIFKGGFNAPMLFIKAKVC